MNATDIKSLQIDSAWGSLIANLEKEGLSPGEIAAVKSEFAQRFFDESKPINDWMREVYQKINPSKQERDELTEQIYLYLQELKEKTFETWWNGKRVNNQKIMDELEKGFLQQIDNLVSIGHKSMWIVDEFFSAMYPHWQDKDKELKHNSYQAMANTFYQEIWDGYQRGEPGYFGPMASLLKDRRISQFTLVDKEPINDVECSVHILHRLAKLGVKEAIRALVSIYERNSIGDSTWGKPDTSVELKFSDAERFAALEELARSGDSYATHSFGRKIYFGETKVKLSVAQRRDYFQQIVAGGVPNYYVTLYYYDGAMQFGGECDILTCLAKLEQLARAGYEDAYKYLLKAYLTGWIGSNKRSFNIKTEERWRKLQELKDIDIPLWAETMSKYYLCGRIGTLQGDWPIPLSKSKRYQWMIDNAKYDIRGLSHLFYEGSYDSLPEKDKAPNLRSKEGQMKFCYDLALADPKSIEPIKCVLELLFDWWTKHKYQYDPPAERKMELVETLALAGQSKAQDKYLELIQENKSKYMASEARRKTIAKMATLTRKSNVSSEFIHYLGGSEEEKFTLGQLANYQKVLVILDDYYRPTG